MLDAMLFRPLETIKRHWPLLASVRVLICNRGRFGQPLGKAARHSSAR